MKVTARKYHKSSLTPAKRKFAQHYAKTDNAVESVKTAYPEMVENSSYNVIADKGYLLLKNAEVATSIEQQKKRMEVLADRSVTVFSNHLESDNQQVANTTARYVYDQVHGKALSRNTNLNIEANVSDIISRLT